jgi:pyruvate,water dikinase
MSVSVRSAGVASHPGQYETYLNIIGVSDLLKKIVWVWSSSFNLRSLSSQIREKGKLFDKNPISVCILKMVNTRAAGVAFTADPSTGDSTKIMIEANWGLGESVVSGNTTPDRFVLEKQTLRIKEKKLGQKKRCVLAVVIGVSEEETPFEKVSNFCLRDEEVIEIGKLGKILEEHFDNTPQDLEWAIDAELPSPNNVILLQTRPAIVAKKKDATEQILDQMLRCLYDR